MTAPQLAPGTIVAQKYQIGACFGFGGSAATYQAATADGREVVLKIFDPAIRQRADIMSAIEQTYAATNALPQDMAVPLLDAGYDQGTGAPFSVSERIPFPSLAQLVAQRPLPVEDVASIVTAIGTLLEQAQGRQLFHHALKPTNVFVGLGGHAERRGVRVTDFGGGLARAAVPTQEGYAIAAPWLAPEQMQAGAPAGAAADVFAISLIMFHALTGRSYWRSCQGAVDLAAWQQELVSPRIPPSQRAIQLGLQLNPAYDAVIGCGLALDPSQRYRTVAELAHAFESVAGAKVQESQATMAFPAGAFGLMGGPGGGGHGGEYPPPPQPTGGYAAPPPAAGYPGAAPGQQPYVPAPPYSQPGGMPIPLGGEPAYGVPGQPTGGYGQPPVAAQAGYVATQNAAQQELGETAAGRVLNPVAAQRAGNSNKLIPAILGAVVLVLVGTGVFAWVKLGKKSDGGAATSASAIAIPAPAESAAPADSAATAPAETASAAPAETAAAAPSASASASASADAAAGVDATLACDPDPCDEIKVDDKTVELGKPVTLTPGKHVITASKKDYLPYKETVTVAAGDKVEKTFKLTAKPTAPSGPAQAPAGPSKPCGKFLKRCK